MGIIWAVDVGGHEAFGAGGRRTWWGRVVGTRGRQPDSLWTQPRPPPLLLKNRSKTNFPEYSQNRGGKAGEEEPLLDRGLRDTASGIVYMGFLLNGELVLDFHMDDVFYGTMFIKRPPSPSGETFLPGGVEHTHILLFHGTMPPGRRPATPSQTRQGSRLREVEGALQAGMGRHHLATAAALAALPASCRFPPFCPGTTSMPAGGTAAPRQRAPHTLPAHAHGVGTRGTLPWLVSDSSMPCTYSTSHL